MKLEDTLVSKPSAELLQELTSIRRHLHAHPDLSEAEYETSAFIAKQLRQLPAAVVIEMLGGIGLAAIFDSGKKGKTLLFRAELDALPIQETNNFDHRSLIPGVSHKCGHDGHATVLLGLAKVLADQPPQSGKVILLFQPAEEIGSGATAVLADTRFTDLQPDLVFAFHNLPGFGLHEIVIKTAAFTAAVKSMIVSLYGKTAHAAEPEHGINPALAISEILLAVDELSRNDIEREDFSVITPIQIEMGDESYGVSAGNAKLRFTLRCWTQDALDQLAEVLVHSLEQIAAKHGLGLDIGWTNIFHANENDASAVAYIEQAANANHLRLTQKQLPFKWGEDFGLFTQRYAGAMFGIGAGEDCPALHNPDYDFPDELIETGIRVFHTIILSILK